MTQVLLRNNTRALVALAAVSTAPIIVGGLLLWLSSSGPSSWIIPILGWTLIAGGCLLTSWQLWSLRQPRLACSTDELLVYLNGLAPIRVPLEIVECFFLGQAPAMVSRLADDEIESSTVVVRLAERATDWHRREVQKHLGHWCDGYIIVRGTWCEPLSRDLVNRMNSELAAMKRARKVVQV